MSVVSFVHVVVVWYCASWHSTNTFVFAQVGLKHECARDKRRSSYFHKMAV